MISIAGHFPGFRQSGLLAIVYLEANNSELQRPVLNPIYSCMMWKSPDQRTVERTWGLDPVALGSPE